MFKPYKFHWIPILIQLTRLIWAVQFIVATIRYIKDYIKEHQLQNQVFLYGSRPDSDYIISQCSRAWFHWVNNKHPFSPAWERGEKISSYFQKITNLFRNYISFKCKIQTQLSQY